MTHMKIILGSTSPRRKEILSFFTLPFEVASPLYEESHQHISFDSPQEYAIKISENKAKSLISSFPQSILLTADTIVYFQGKIYTKPSSEEEAFKILLELNSHWHSVFTAVSCVKNQVIHSFCEETKVLFSPLTEKQIRLYHDHFYYLDKAAGYAIQGSGSIIVKQIEGCYYNIMGLPINATREALYSAGIDLWDYLKK